MPNHESSTDKTTTTTEASPNELLAHAQGAADTPTESEELLDLLMQKLALELLAEKKTRQAPQRKPPAHRSPVEA